MRRNLLTAWLTAMILLVASVVSAADVRWVGGAAATKHVEKITIADTWAPNDTLTLTCGNGTLVLTVGTASATSDVAAALAAAINGTDTTPGLVGDESRSQNGQTINEFQDFTAEASGSVCTITANVAGLPFATAVSGDGTTGDGTATQAVVTQATGPNHADNATNWGGTLPTSVDTMVFDTDAPDCSFGLGYFVTNTIMASLRVTTDFEGTIGLPYTRVAVSGENGGYTEYRDRYFGLYDATSPSETIEFSEGINGGSGGYAFLDLSSWDGTSIKIRNCGTLKTTPSVEIVDGNSTSCFVRRGWVAFDPPEAGFSDGHDFDDVSIGIKGLANTSTKATFGILSTWDGTIATELLSGTVTYDAVIDDSANETTLVVEGADVTLRGSQTLNAVTIKAGDVHWNGSGSAPGAIAIWTQGSLDLTNDGESQSYGGGVTMHGGSTLIKGGHTVTPSFVGCYESDCTITP